MVRVKIKRVYEPEEKSDGFRILVDKLWPRGIKKENLHYDLWVKGIAPSTSLRQWYHEDMERRWPEFREKYIEELETSDAVRNFINQIKWQKTITFLYASRDREKNHALVLQDFLEKHL